MLQAFLNAFKIQDLRRKILFTFGVIAVYRFGTFIPTPGIDGAQLAMFFENIKRTQGGTLFGVMNLFSGGALDRLTIFALGIMPYISSSIIMQLLTVVIPALEKLRSMLFENGVLFLSTPNASHWVESYLTDPEKRPAFYGHVRAHNPSSLCGVLRMYGLGGELRSTEWGAVFLARVQRTDASTSPINWRMMSTMMARSCSVRSSSSLE